MADAEDEPGDRRWRSAETLQGLFDHMEEFWQSPQGQQLHAEQRAAEADLQAWLADQPGIVIHRHGGQVPEQWEGEVDGHSFYFRERGGEWDIEVDLRPSGSVRVVDGTNDDGTTRYRQQEVIQGDAIASGTTGAEGYGANPRERAEFIVTTIRDHLRRGGDVPMSVLLAADTGHDVDFEPERLGTARPPRTPEL